LKYEIRPDYSITWYKRRSPTPQPQAISVVINGLELVKNHACEMIATYDDGNTYELSARVHHNEIKDTWAVQGIDAKGHSVVVDLVENG